MALGRIALAAAAICVATASSSLRAADVATLAVAVNGNDVSVNVSAGALDDSSALYLVWDVDDHGPNLLNWPAENRIAYSGAPAISSAAATYTLSKAAVPAGASMRVIATSDVRLIDGYVKLGAYQYVNTDVSATLVHGLRIKYRYVGTLTGGSYASLMGGVLDADFTIGRHTNGSFYFRWHDAVNNTALSGLANSTDMHEITVADRVASLDGVPKISNLAAGAMGTIDRPVILGATWKNTSPYTELSGRYLHAKWYYATLYDSEHEALVNLVPALRGDGASTEAVFYDTVSGACFANAGTGTLEYGGDVTNTVACMAAASSLLYNGRIATWTGLGNRSNVNDPGNWVVSDASGAVVANGVPDSSTDVFLQGASNFTCSAEQTLACRRVLFSDVKLADDCDWSGLTNSSATAIVSYAGNIDLAGHKLTLPSSIFSAGAITDTVGRGELHLGVDGNCEFTTSDMTLSGSLKLVKEGAGVLVGTKAGQTYTGGTLVSGGWLKRGVNDRPFGAEGALITVADGAAFDWKGGWKNGGTSTAYDFSIAGSGPDGNGAIVSSASSATWNVGAIANLELADDALIGGYGGWGFNYVGNTAAQKHTVTMNGHTLNIKIRGTTGVANTGSFQFRNVTTVGSGTIAIIDYDTTSTDVFPAFFTRGSDLSSVTFDLGEGYSISVDGVEVKVGTFIDRRSNDISRGNKALAVLDCFKPMTKNLVRSVTLGDATHLAPVLDLSELDGPFVLPSATHFLSAAAGATVRVDLGGRKTSNRRPIVSWTTPPDGVSFAWPDGVTGRGSLVMKDDGLYVAKGLTIIVR